MRFSIRSLLLLTILFAFGVALFQPRRSKWEAMSVEAAVERLEKTIQLYEPEFKFAAKPLSATQIAKLRGELPNAPEQFFELLAINDYRSSQLFSLWETIEYDELKAACKKTKETYLSLSPNDGWYGGDKFECCQSDKIWRDEWIPIGYVNGNEVFIDMAPSKNGIRGQIVAVETDGWYMRVLGYSIAHWLHRIADQIEADGQYSRTPFAVNPIPPPR